MIIQQIVSGTCGICQHPTALAIECVLCQRPACLNCVDLYHQKDFTPPVCRECGTVPQVVDLREHYRKGHEKVMMEHAAELENLRKQKTPPE